MSAIHSTVQMSNVSEHLCLYHLLEDQAKRAPEAPAILAPNHAPLTYGRLHGHIDYVVQTLRTMGLRRTDRVALVLPNGPEMAVAFLAVAIEAICAPLNPHYSTSEFDFYLTNLRAQALIIQTGMDSPASAVARARGLRLIELSPVLGAEAGLFRLENEERRASRLIVSLSPTMWLSYCIRRAQRHGRKSYR